MEQEDAKPGRFGDCSEIVIGACIEVHRHLGPGLLESAYEHAVARELVLRGLRFDRQRPVHLEYKGEKLDCVYRLDLVVEDALVVEIKCVDQLLPIHRAQLLTYLRLTGLPTGLLVNFRETALKNGLRRLSLSRNFPSHRRPAAPPKSGDDRATGGISLTVDWSHE